MENNVKKDLILEHRQLVARFKGEDDIRKRLKEIEELVGMTPDQLASEAINDYMRQY